MKHKLSITLLLLAMFLVTQFIGLYVVNQYNTRTEIDPSTGKNITINELPFGLQTPEDEKPGLLYIISAFALAFILIFLLMKYQWKTVIRIWFLFVISIALGITIHSLIKNVFASASLIALIIAIPLAIMKIFRPNKIIHNATELLIYPGIAAVFVPILTPLSIILLLILISIYDMWAVWKSGVMQKMAKFQMEELKIFGGFLIPSISKKVKEQIKNLKQKYQGKKMPKHIKTKKFKVNLAILGGGDIIFPIITAGVFLKAFGLAPALFIIFGSLASLSYLFFITEKGKAYPAMPYITTGIFAGLVLWALLRALQIVI